MTDVPRLRWPLRIDPATGGLDVVEQDSDEDIAQCVRGVLLHRVGDRVDVPEMGVPDLAHREQPLDLDGVQSVLRRHEPRVDVLLTQHPDAIDEQVANVTAAWRRHPDRAEQED